MADAVNRIVPSSVGLDRASWHGQERQRKKEKKSRASSLRVDDRAAPDPTADGDPDPPGRGKEKGKFLDVTV
jgi:hypothetical protein